MGEIGACSRPSAPPVDRCGTSERNRVKRAVGRGGGAQGAQRAERRLREKLVQSASDVCAPAHRGAYTRAGIRGIFTRWRSFFIQNPPRPAQSGPLPPPRPSRPRSTAEPWRSAPSPGGAGGAREQGKGSGVRPWLIFGTGMARRLWRRPPCKAPARPPER